MPQDSATVRTALASRSNTNPAPTVAGLGQVVTLVLVFERQFVPEDLHDALITKYGAGKVVSDQDATAFGRYRWRVKA